MESGHGTTGSLVGTANSAKQPRWYDELASSSSNSVPVSGSKTNNVAISGNVVTLDRSNGKNLGMDLVKGFNGKGERRTPYVKQDLVHCGRFMKRCRFRQGCTFAMSSSHPAHSTLTQSVAVWLVKLHLICVRECDRVVDTDGSVADVIGTGASVKSVNPGSQVVPATSRTCVRAHTRMLGAMAATPPCCAFSFMNLHGRCEKVKTAECIECFWFCYSSLLTPVHLAQRYEHVYAKAVRVSNSLLGKTGRRFCTD